MALATNALTTVATIEDELGISSGTEDARLQRMINEASAIAESYAGRSFYRDATISEDTWGGDGPYMFLAKPPINSITSISFLDSALSTSDYEIHAANSGIVYAISGSWSRLGVNFVDISRTQASGIERKPYTAVYDGGWYTPKQDDDDVAVTRSLPYDIERAVILIVSHLRRSMGRDPSVTEETLLRSSMSYAGSTKFSGSQHWLKAVIPGAASILDTYKMGILR